MPELRLLGLPPEDRRLAFEQTGARLGLAPATVEKDFWVCWTLRTLFTLPAVAEHLTFKGGTSLSKAWGLLDRFSEDVDLTIHRTALGSAALPPPEAAPSRSARERLLKAVVSACSNFVLGPVRKGLMAQLAVEAPDSKASVVTDPDDRDAQTLLLAYPSQFTSGPGRYLRPEVKLEFGARAEPSPSETRSGLSFVGEAFPGTFADAGFTARALSPRRTFWEKAMLLHEETFRPADKPRGARMARHYYDLHRLIEQGVGREAARDLALFARVAEQRRTVFARRWVDYDTLRPGTLRLLPPPSQEEAWRYDYRAMQPEMFRGSPPPFDAILHTLREFEAAFNAQNAADA